MHIADHAPGPVRLSVAHAGHASRSMLRVRVARLAAVAILAVPLLQPAQRVLAAPAATPVAALITGEIERISLNNPNDVWSGGTMVVGGQNVSLPRNLLIDLPANRMSLQQLFAGAPRACLGLAESGLAKADACNVSGTGGIATIAANRSAAGNVIAGDVFVQKGVELVSGIVTLIDYTDGYFRLNGIAGDASTGVMVRLNDPGNRHTVQGGRGCAGGPNCSPDSRFGLDPDNYTSVFSTGYPVCLPSTSPRSFTDMLDFNGNGNTTEQLIARSAPDGTGDLLCPDTNRTGPSVTDSRRFAPIQAGDHLTVKGNFETIGGVRFLSAWNTRVSRVLTTNNLPGQPDYMLLDSMFLDAPGFQLDRIRDQFIGYTTQATSDVDIWSVHHDPLTNAPHEFPLATVVGCETAGGIGTCAGVLGRNSFKIRHDVVFGAGAARKLRSDPCAQLRFDRRFASLNPCPQGGTFEEQFGVMSPVPHEVQARTGLKMADMARAGGPTLRTLDIRGIDSTNGQYLFPMGIGLGGVNVPAFLEININALDTPFSFDGIPWNLDRRLSPGGCVTACEATPQPLDPFPVAGFDPRTQANTPAGPYTDPLYTASMLSIANNRILSFVDGAIRNFNGDRTVLAWPPITPAALGIQPTPPLTVASPRSLITGITPTIGAVGTRVLIDGNGLGGVTGVSFGGAAATSFSGVSPTQVSAVVPSGALSGPIAVTTSTATLNSLIRFTVVSQPTLTSFAPAAGAVGTAVTLTGTGLTSTTDVAFNGVSAPFNVISDTAVRASVPAVASTGTIQVTTVGGVVSTGPFAVGAAPTINGYAPTRAPVGATVLINGTGLVGVTGVSFGGVPAVSFRSISPTQVASIVPVGALSGPIDVTLASGPASTGPSFSVAPSADLALTGTNPPDPVSVGVSMAYVFSVANNGPSAASNTILTDSVPAGVVFVAAAASQGACVQQASVVTCSLGALAAGASAQVTIKMSPTSTVGGTITSVANVAASEFDPVTANNTLSLVNHYPVRTAAQSSSAGSPPGAQQDLHATTSALVPTAASVPPAAVPPTPSLPTAAQTASPATGSIGSGSTPAGSASAGGGSAPGVASAGGSGSTGGGADVANVADFASAPLLASVSGPTLVTSSASPAPSASADVSPASPFLGDAATLGIIDPFVGGTIIGSGGAVSVTIPANASTGMLIVRLAADSTGGNLRLGTSNVLRLTVEDSQGNSVTTFGQPLQITLRPSADDLAAVGGDASALMLEAQDPISDAFDVLASTIGAGGEVTVSLDRLAMAPVASANSTPGGTPVVDESVSDPMAVELSTLAIDSPDDVPGLIDDEP